MTIDLLLKKKKPLIINHIFHPRDQKMLLYVAVFMKINIKPLHT